MEIQLPNPDRSITAYRLSGTPIPFEKHAATDFPRIAYAAAHVVADPLASNDPWLTPAIDWDTTLKFRHRLWTSASASPKPWIPRSAAWASPGPRRRS